jgi:FkbM family methyltransferase
MSQRKILIDCGTHFGQGLDAFILKFNVDSSWIVHTFEANPATFYQLEHNQIPRRYKDRKRIDYVTYHNKAISTKNSMVRLNIETHPDEDFNDTGQGTSIINLDQWNPHNGGTKPFFRKCCDVPCIHFSEFIMKNFTKDDFIVIKMDIEGEEYNVLEDMISSDIISWIDYIAIEFHAQHFTNREEMKAREDNIIKVLDEKNIKYERWI